MRLTLAGVLALIAVPAAAQAPIGGRLIELAPDTRVYAYTSGNQVLSAFPDEWRDSVLRAFIASIETRDGPLPEPVTPGVRGEVSLRLLRSGDLYRVSLIRSLGSPTADSMLLAGARKADELLAFPKFPDGAPGAGTELRIQIHAAHVLPPGARSIPLPGLVMAATAGPGCDSVFATPNTARALPLWLEIEETSGGNANGPWARNAATQVAELVPRRLEATPGTRPTILVDDPTADRRLPAAYRLTFDATGQLLDLTVVAGSDYPALDSAIVGAIRTAAATRSFPPPASTRRDTATIELGLAIGREPSPDAFRLGQVVLRHWALTVVPTVRQVSPMQYPPLLREAGVGGRVELEFVVGVDGEPDPGSFRVLSSPHPELTQRAIEAVRATKFHPARVDNCIVASMVRQGVNFNPHGSRPIRARDVQTTRPIN